MFGRRRFSPSGWGECVSRAEVRPHGHPARRRRSPPTRDAARGAISEIASASLALLLTMSCFLCVDIAECRAFDSTCEVFVSMLNRYVNQMHIEFSVVVLDFVLK